MNRKIILAVFLGLLAAASSLIASLFMLQEIKSATGLKAQVENIHQAVSNINTTVDLSPVNDKITQLVTEINTLGKTVEEIKSGTNTGTEGNGTTQPPVTTNPNQTTPTTPDTSTTPTNPTTPPNPPQSNVKSTYRLNLRVDAGTTSQLIKTLQNGSTLTPLGEEKDKDGMKWIKVQDATGKIGWVAKQYTN